MSKMQLNDISVKLSLDPLDLHIIEAMSPGKFVKVYQIRTILEHNGIYLGYSEISTRLRLLSMLSVVEREKTSRVYLYKLSNKFESR